MKRVDFNQDWLFTKGDGEPVPVSLPHDAMLHEERDPSCASGKTTGYFPGGIYTYTKTFAVPMEWAGKSLYLEFEGVYQNAIVKLNGQELCRRPYGYTNFSVELTDLLHTGDMACIEVIADNSGEPCTRWYSGSGIYRPVWLYVGEKSHVEIDGVQITTISHDPATVRIRTLATSGVPCITIRREGKTVASAEGNDVEVVIPDAALWSDETPDLYDCDVSLKECGTEVDRAAVRFGICRLEWSTRGLFINGKETKLRGACIHHDNGILGACEFPAAALRRARILKEAGFNAVRSAHNPMSRAMLDACDTVGLYVMDEFCDMWYEHKNRYDYASHFEQWHTADLTAMVRKDVSHPSVIMYSIGNEVTETAEPWGIELTKEMSALCRRLDGSRPVTCGINMALNTMHFAGLGVYRPGSDEPPRREQPKNPRALALLAQMGQADQESRAAGMKAGGNSETAGNASIGLSQEAGARQDGKLVGSEFFNEAMKTMKERQREIVCQPIAEILSEDAYAVLDIAGYNYADGRYEKDAAQYLDRISVGTETLPQRIYKNWQLVKKLPYLTGDFMWSGWDYIGEAGVGAFCYDSVGTKDKEYPALLAGCGVIDITGNPRPEVWLNKAVFGLSEKPYIGVEPVIHAGENRLISAWRFSDAVHSWSWAGCEGRQAELIVYSSAVEVEVLINDRSIGRQPVEECQTKFTAEYQPGRVEAIAYDRTGAICGRDELVTAGDDTVLTIVPSKTTLAADGQDLCYLDILLTDVAGIVKTSEDRAVSVSVTGAGTLAGFGSADPFNTESYTGNTHRTYYGRVQAVVRADCQPGEIIVSVNAGELGEYVEHITVQ